MALKLCLVAFAVTYLAAVAGLFLFQRALLYFPEDVYVPFSKAAFPAAFQELSVRTQDGLDLIGWYEPPQASHSRSYFFMAMVTACERLPLLPGPM
jgi:uncharacterized protein